MASCPATVLCAGGGGGSGGGGGGGGSSGRRCCGWSSWRGRLSPLSVHLKQEQRTRRQHGGQRAHQLRVVHRDNAAAQQVVPRPSLTAKSK